MDFKINPCLKNFTLDGNNVCDLCQKKLVTEKELATLDLSCKDEEVCVITTVSRVNASYLTNAIRVARVAILIVFGSSLFTLRGFAQEAIAQLQSNLYTSVEQTQEAIIRGSLIDKETGEPLPFANVYISHQGTLIGCVSDFDGKFSLQLPRIDELSLPITLKISLIGYESYEIQISKLIPDGIVVLDPIELGYDEDQFSVGLIFEPSPFHDIMDPNAHRSTTIKSEEIKRSPYRK